jgi:hypothetical protein
MNWNRTLRLELQFADNKLVVKAGFVDPLEQPWTQGAVHLNRRSQDFVRDLVDRCIHQHRSVQSNGWAVAK